MTLVTLEGVRGRWQDPNHCLTISLNGGKFLIKPQPDTVFMF